ncbi:hypothetical protein LIER_08453 [Lithospermum erythrorhizon]|uniref:Uncharacterized protein n=1 Tax=Lithospermum erythrorhizon TaxID=34254 RepID=A0AAV3PC63_LITER
MRDPTTTGGSVSRDNIHPLLLLIRSIRMTQRVRLRCRSRTLLATTLVTYVPYEEMIVHSTYSPMAKRWRRWLIGDEVNRFFTQQIRRAGAIHVWPHYDNIDGDVKDEIWTAFLKVSTVESDVAVLKALVMKLAGTIPVESIPPLAASHASGGSSSVTSLLAQMERIHTQFSSRRPSRRPRCTPTVRPAPTPAPALGDPIPDPGHPGRYF